MGDDGPSGPTEWEDHGAHVGGHYFIVCSSGGGNEFP